MNNDYYVYVYIDPRNHEEFYVGKGSGNRKDSHLKDSSNSSKVKRLKQIKRAGAVPMIRVVARGLTAREAFLVEKTLIWKSRKGLENVATGHYAENFRPPNTLHRELPLFDFRGGVYYYNVGEGLTRNWEDYAKYGIISAGGDKPQWSRAMKGFHVGDVVCAYLKRKSGVGGYVGVGVIEVKARPIQEVIVSGKPLLSQPLKAPEAGRNIGEHCEWVAKVRWQAKATREKAKWESGLFTSQLVRASLEDQPKTLQFLEESFSLRLHDLMD